MKKILSCIFAMSLCAAMLSACGSETSVSDNVIADTNDVSADTEETTTDSEIAKFIEEKLSEHNWSAGMSEEEFKAATPDVTYTMNADMSMVTETFVMKQIDSDSTFDFDGHNAYVSATFTDDSLDAIEYAINFNEGSRVDTPAHDYYTELTFDFYEKFGNPDSQDSDLNSILNTYRTSWHDDGLISVSCIENQPNLVIEYSGTVYIRLYFI